MLLETTLVTFALIAPEAIRSVEGTASQQTSFHFGIADLRRELTLSEDVNTGRQRPAEVPAELPVLQQGSCQITGKRNGRGGHDRRTYPGH
jgi:hypothetical protein